MGTLRPEILPKPFKKSRKVVWLVPKSEELIRWYATSSFAKYHYMKWFAKSDPWVIGHRVDADGEVWGHKINFRRQDKLESILEGQATNVNNLFTGEWLHICLDFSEYEEVLQQWEREQNDTPLTLPYDMPATLEFGDDNVYTEPLSLRDPLPKPESPTPKPVDNIEQNKGAPTNGATTDSPTLANDREQDSGAATSGATTLTPESPTPANNSEQVSGATTSGATTLAPESPTPAKHDTVTHGPKHIHSTLNMLEHWMVPEICDKLDETRKALQAKEEAETQAWGGYDHEWICTSHVGDERDTDTLNGGTDETPNEVANNKTIYIRENQRQKELEDISVFESLKATVCIVIDDDDEGSVFVETSSRAKRPRVNTVQTTTIPVHAVPTPCRQRTPPNDEGTDTIPDSQYSQMLAMGTAPPDAIATYAAPTPTNAPSATKRQRVGDSQFVRT